MKRITYMSRFSRPLSDEGLRLLGEKAAANNAEHGITGILITIGETFFQIIEGEDAAIDALFTTISRDSRHTDIVRFSTEMAISERLFASWSMKTVNLDKEPGEIVAALRTLVRNLSLAHYIVERYTQPAVSAFLQGGRNPLDVLTKKCERVVVFMDIVGFSLMMALRPIDEMCALVNDVLDRCAGAVSAYGGEVTKFLGDGLLAYWNAKEMDLALEGTVASCEAVRRIREEAPSGSVRKVTHVGFGLSLGEVIEGNFGSKTKTDYTILGDSVNLAARIEKISRKVGRPICVTEAVTKRASTKWQFEDLGVQPIPGIQDTVRVFALDHPAAKELIAKQDLIAFLQNPLAPTPGPSDLG
ncbi:MAG: hypothetical protein GX625_18235 [Clostridiaceae bacterium]|nr:hypothetical protein [Clostridiaceae bacterium]